MRNHHEVIRRCALPLSSAGPLSSSEADAEMSEEAAPRSIDDVPSLAVPAAGEGGMETD